MRTRVALLLLPALALILAVLPSLAWAGVTKDACTHFEGNTDVNDTTVHTVASGANFLTVFVGQDNDRPATNIETAIWDQGGSAQSMTAVADNNGVGVIVGKAWTLINPVAGNKTLRVTVTSGQSAGCCDVKICSWFGVNTSNPVGTIVETESTGAANESLAFTNPTGGIGVAYLITQSALTSFAQGADQTEEQRATNSCNADCDGVLTTATISPINYTYTGTTVDYWHVILPLNAQAPVQGSTIPLELLQ